MSVSLCMIVKDEEAMLPRCLASVRHLVDEMVVVDTGSTDRTKEIAREMGAAVYDFAWCDSFAEARNFSLSKASMDWILLMDADDELEAEDGPPLRALLAKDDDSDAYYFQTLSFMGSVPDKNLTISNLNVRLVRNHRGFRFKGDIHEQLVCDSKPASRIGVAGIRVYHYGYLDNVVAGKAKRERNMALVKKELQKDPDNPFMLCNMGNECYSLRRFDEALDWYLKSYAQFDSRRGYSSKLLVRMVSCCELLGKAADQEKYITEGLKHYPDFTDLEFIRASHLLRQRKFMAAIRSFKKCLKMGDPPPLYSYAPGVGSYRAQYMLFSIYDELGDREAALRWCRAAIRSNPDYTDAYLQMGRMLLENQMPPERVRAALERLAQPVRHPERYALLSDVFYTLRQYDTALALVRKAKTAYGGDATADYNEGACLVRLRRFGEAAAVLEKVTDGEPANKALFLLRLCALLDSRIVPPPRGDGAWFEVMDAFGKIAQGIMCYPLSDNEEDSQRYVIPIFSLLELLIQLGEFDLFDRGRQLLNLVSDDSVLLRLGKLYFKNGFKQLAFGELTRSLTLTGRIDAEALDMIKQCLPAPR